MLGHKQPWVQECVRVKNLDIDQAEFNFIT